jgi:rRNA maturation protein Nop10
MELINCHDCEQSVSFTAASCPHCGSIEPAGPYRFNRKEARRYRIEERNDRTLILMTVGFGVVGAFYGAESSSSMLGALIVGLWYGFLGVVIGMLLAFAINITRNWR